MDWIKKNYLALVCERTIPTEQRRLLAKLVPAFADRRYCVVSATDPSGRILSFLDRPLLVLPSSSSIVLTRLSGPRSRPTASQEIWK
jgi:hypothetical protein